MSTMTTTRTPIPAGPWTVDDLDAFPWLVDPDGGVVTVLELQDGSYREVARGTAVEVVRPFRVTVRL